MWGAVKKGRGVISTHTTSRLKAGLLGETRGTRAQINTIEACST